MTDKTISTTIEILGKLYPIRCPESELKALQEAAAYLNEKMLEVKDSGKVINLERIAIISGLNIAYEFLRSDRDQISWVGRVNQRLVTLQERLESAIKQSHQGELIYDLK